MAFMEIKLYSVTLGLATAVDVLLPERRQARTPLKVLWLLHGFSGDHSVWCRQTGIERYVSGKDLCVIMPAVDRSFYADMAYGNNYYTYVSEELPQMMLNMLPISSKKEDNYIAGLSMGGYGTFKLALNQPERFAAAASLSGSVDIQALFENDSQLDDNIIRQFDLIFGGQDKFRYSMNDLRHMAELRKEDTELPRLYMCCGKDDSLYEVNQRYLTHLEKLGIPVTYEEEDGYGHVWEYWDKKIQRVLDWMGL